MIAQGFKPVGWVAAVAGAALGCYMLSLNVASERADLGRVERQIIATKQDIRSLQTELGTRGRMAQLEQWNADVLALSAPVTTQFLDNEVKLARFEQRAPTLEERGEVRMAAVETLDTKPKTIEAPVVQAAAPAPPPFASQGFVHRASLDLAAIKTPKPQSAAGRTGGNVEMAAMTTPEMPPARVRAASIDQPTAVKAQAPRQSTRSRIDSSLAREIGAAAKAEAGSGTR